MLERGEMATPALSETDITQMTGRKRGSQSLVLRVGLGRQAISGRSGLDSRRRAADAEGHGCVAPRPAVVGQAPDARRPRTESDERPARVNIAPRRTIAASRSGRE